MSMNPVAVLGTAVRYRELLWQLTLRELQSRYKGTIAGFAWYLLLPLAMLGVYTFVFGVVFQARWSGSVPSKTEYAQLIFAGMIVYNLFAETVSRAPNVITSSVTYVKKVVFPLELLPLVPVCVALINAAISFVILIVAGLLLRDVPATAPLAFLVLVPFVVLTAGVVFLLSSIGVWFRDLAATIGIVLTALMFLSPVFYPAEAVPPSFRWLLAVNPLTLPVEQLRAVLWGRAVDWSALAIYLACGLAVFAAAWVIFSASRRAFADAI